MPVDLHYVDLVSANTSSTGQKKTKKREREREREKGGERDGYKMRREMLVIST